MLRVKRHWSATGALAFASKRPRRLWQIIAWVAWHFWRPQSRSPQKVQYCLSKGSQPKMTFRLRIYNKFHQIWCIFWYFAEDSFPWQLFGLFVFFNPERSTLNFLESNIQLNKITIFFDMFHKSYPNSSFHPFHCRETFMPGIFVLRRTWCWWWGWLPSPLWINTHLKTPPMGGTSSLHS